jgi:hypothetical protein
VQPRCRPPAPTTEAPPGLLSGSGRPGPGATADVGLSCGAESNRHPRGRGLRCWPSGCSGVVQLKPRPVSCRDRAGPGPGATADVGLSCGAESNRHPRGRGLRCWPSGCSGVVQQSPSSWLHNRPVLAWWTPAQRPIQSPAGWRMRQRQANWRGCEEAAEPLSRAGSRLLASSLANSAVVQFVWLASAAGGPGQLVRRR